MELNQKNDFKLIKSSPILAKIQSDLDTNYLNHLLQQNIDGVVLEKASSQTEQ